MNRLRFPAIVMSTTLWMCFLTTLAQAWNPSGHMIVALIAYDQMDDATKAKAVELLRAHPRFQDHFQHFMPKEIVSASQAKQDEWCFAHAATWPDVMREAKSVVTRDDVTKYHRGIWHYVDIPIYLNEDEQHQLDHDVNQNLSREIPANPDDPTMNVIQAERNAEKIVGDKNAEAANRSVYLCWLLHLVGDSHQPLHSMHSLPRIDSEMATTAVISWRQKTATSCTLSGTTPSRATNLTALAAFWLMTWGRILN